MPTQDEQDYQDYLDYLEYQKRGQVPEPVKAPEEQYGQVETAANRGLNSLLMGYLPQVKGGIAKVSGNDYISARDRESARLSQMAEQNPGSALAGDIAGGLASIVIPGGSLAKGATLGKAALRGAGVAAAQGALMNPGEQKGEMAGLQVGNRLTNAAIAAPFGAVAGAGSAALNKAGRAAEDIAMVKQPGKLLDTVTGEINKAKGSLKSSIGSVQEKVDQALAGKQVTLSADEINSLSPEARDMVLNAVRPNNPSILQPATSYTGEAADVNAVKKALYDEARFAERTLAGDPKLNKLRNQEMGTAGGRLAGRLESSIPEVGPLQSRTSDLYKLSDLLQQQTQNAPLEGIKRGTGTTGAGVIDKVAQETGVDLGALGDRIKTASGRVLKDSVPEVLMEPRKLAVRASIEAGAKANKVPQKAREAQLRALLNTILLPRDNNEPRR